VVEKPRRCFFLNTLTSRTDISRRRQVKNTPKVLSSFHTIFTIERLSRAASEPFGGWAAGVPAT
jgi:hypothetical protein